MSLLRAPTYRSFGPTATLSRPPERIPACLANSAIARESARALDGLLGDLHREPNRDLMLAVVPGASEEWGHHRAPPRETDGSGTRISREFSRRLQRAFSLLEHDIVRYILISGGSVDSNRPEYNEALRGRDALMDFGQSRWMHSRGTLADRILVDPQAKHSTTNLRNASKLCVDLGLERMLIATTMPPTPLLWPVMLPVLYQTSQGWYFLHHRLSTFDWRCRRELGYTLGAFSWFESGRRSDRITAIVHVAFPIDRLRADSYAP